MGSFEMLPSLACVMLCWLLLPVSPVQGADDRLVRLEQELTHALQQLRAHLAGSGAASAPPTPTPPAAGRCLGTHDAATAPTLSGAEIKQQRLGWTGQGYVDLSQRFGARLGWLLQGCPAGPAVLTFRYALSPVRRRQAVRLFVNNVEMEQALIATPAAGWRTMRCVVALRDGRNNITLESAGHGGPGVDSLAVAQGATGDYPRLTPVQRPPPHTTANGNLFFFTILSRPYREYCEMLRSAAHNGITMHVYGWGDPAFLGWQGVKRKLPHAMRILKGLPESLDAIYFDAADVVFNGGPAEIARAFKALGKPIAFSTERNCWVKALPMKTCEWWPKPANGSPYRWLNSGMYVGNVGALNKMMARAYEEMPTSTNCVNCGDQAVYSKMWLVGGWNTTIALDFNQTILQSLFMSVQDLCPTTGTSVRLRNCLTGATPLAFHFNGRNAPYNFTQLYKRLSWYGKPLPADRVVYVNGARRPMRYLCPDF